MSLSHLKWVAIVAPLTFIVLVHVLIHTWMHELHAWPGILVLFATIAVGVGVFSFAVFALVARLERRIVEQNEQLSALLAVGRAASDSLDLADVLDASLRAILHVTSADAAQVWLASDGELVLEREQARPGQVAHGGARLRLGEGLPGRAAAERAPVVVHDSPGASSVRPEIAGRGGFRAYCALPLVRGGDVVGVLAVAGRARSALSSDAELRLLEGIGEQIAVAIENARLHERVLDRAVLEERERLAHELHDGMAQVLGYVNTQSLAIRRLIASGRIADAQEQLEAIAVAARAVYADVREAILGLRTTRRGLLPSLEAYVAESTRFPSPHLTLELGPGTADLALPAAAEIQLVRIVQEALANVRKHAGAADATVAVTLDGDALIVRVTDDGRGFDLDRPPPIGGPHFGLETMRERAQAVGGVLEIWSRPDGGTTVSVRVPVSTPEEVRLAGAAR